MGQKDWMGFAKTKRSRLLGVTMGLGTGLKGEVVSLWGGW